MDGDIIDQAMKVYSTLPAGIFLRTADCLHLVAALHHGFEEIYTHDAHQIKAASALGLKAVVIS
jgi:hypothetical protein